MDIALDTPATVVYYVVDSRSSVPMTIMYSSIHSAQDELKTLQQSWDEKVLDSDTEIG